MTSTLKHYRKQPDGSLKLVGTETYSFKTKPTEERTGWERGFELRWRDEAELVRRARDCADFEALVDLASEMESLAD